ncbi:hypothetical protein BH09ACT12_BH09ACT12_02840 [soil metagenome]
MLFRLLGFANAARCVPGRRLGHRLAATAY